MELKRSEERAVAHFVSRVGDAFTRIANLTDTEKQDVSKLVRLTRKYVANSPFHARTVLLAAFPSVMQRILLSTDDWELFVPEYVANRGSVRDMARDKSFFLGSSTLGGVNEESGGGCYRWCDRLLASQKSLGMQSRMKHKNNLRSIPLRPPRESCKRNPAHLRLQKEIHDKLDARQSSEVDSVVSDLLFKLAQRQGLEISVLSESNTDGVYEFVVTVGHEQSRNAQGKASIKGQVYEDFQCHKSTFVTDLAICFGQPPITQNTTGCCMLSYCGALFDITEEWRMCILAALDHMCNACDVSCIFMGVADNSNQDVVHSMLMRHLHVMHNMTPVNFDIIVAAAAQEDAVLQALFCDDATVLYQPHSDAKFGGQQRYLAYSCRPAKEHFEEQLLRAAEIMEA